MATYICQRCKKDYSHEHKPYLLQQTKYSLCNKCSAEEKREIDRRRRSSKKDKGKNKYDEL